MSRDDFLPPTHWRKQAEFGYQIALGLRSRPASDAKARRVMAYAILALLDAQPEPPREQRLFRGWCWFPDPHKDTCGRWGIFHDRCPNDRRQDVAFLIYCRDADLEAVFIELHRYIEASGGDTRPLWRRDTSKPWPISEVESAYRPVRNVQYAH